MKIKIFKKLYQDRKISLPFMIFKNYYSSKAFMPYSLVRVASFSQILFFSTLDRGAFLHTFLQLYTKYTLIIGSFTKKYIFGLFSENFHYFSNYGKKFMIFSQYTLSSSSCKSHLGKPTDKSWGCFEITLDRSFHSCKLHHL